MTKRLEKLMIIDGNAVIHRSFHALPPTLRTKLGELVNAVYGFTAFLLKAWKELKPEYIVLTLDKKGPTFRHEAYANYKATRIKAPDELYAQIPLVKNIAEAFSIPIFELSGYEADDLIGTICAQTKNEKNLEKIIITLEVIPCCYTDFYFFMSYTSLTGFFEPKNHYNGKGVSFDYPSSIKLMCLQMRYLQKTQTLLVNLNFCKKLLQ